MKRVRGGRGLGDTIYLRPIVESLIADGERVCVLTDYPDVFIGTGAETEIFGRNDINVLGHYVNGKQDTRTTQWDDICKSAGIRVPLQFSWTPRNERLIASVKAKAGGAPIVLVHGGRVPMARKDKFGAELLPQRAAFDATLDGLVDCFTVCIGNAEQLYPLRVNLELNGSTSVPDLFDLAVICDGIVAQCSFAVPLAEVFDKPLLVIWAAHGMQQNMHPYVRAITPQKILSKPTSHFVVDDWDETNIQKAVRDFRALIGSRTPQLSAA